MATQSGAARPGSTPLHARGAGTRRATAMARGGMVATNHPLATAAGLWALQRGGNATDAALAAAGVCAVVLPAMCGLGGDCFILHYDAKTGNVTSVNGSGAAPMAATPDAYRERGHIAQMPLDGPLSVGVPGSVHAWYTASERWGAIEMRDLLRPAEEYARQGFPLTPDGAYITATEMDRLRVQPGAAAKTFLQDGRTAPHTGQLLRNEPLADTLHLLRRGGAKAFYTGETAAKIGAWMAKNGGLLTTDDFARHRSEIAPALATTYRGHTVYTNPPVSQGIILLAMLNILASTDFASHGPNMPDTLHLMIEAKKLAFADRNRYAGDPAFVDVPLSRFLNPAHGARQYLTIDAQHARTEDPAAAILPEAGGDTTYLCAVDGKGNAVSLIHSISAAFGSGCMVPGTGVLLNNRVGRGFTLQPGHPNVLAPGKRTMHTLLSYIITRPDGLLALVGGTPGGDGQPQWNAQAITNILDFGLSPQEAAEAPRWRSTPGTDPATLRQAYAVQVEADMPEKTVAALRRLGHIVRIVPSGSAGSAMQLIARENGISYGGSDPRTEGIVLGI